MTDEELKQIEDRAEFAGTSIEFGGGAGGRAASQVIDNDVATLIAEVKRLRAILAANGIDHA
jgi:hypothetical protein